MTQTIPQTVDPNLKKEMEKFLADKMTRAFELKQIDYIQMKAIANQILNTIDTLQDFNQFLSFLEDLKNKYPVMGDVYNLYKNKFYKEKEAALIKKLSETINSYAN